MKDLTLPPRLLRVFEDYQAFHRTVGNRYCHLIGIPLIELAVLGLLSPWVLWIPSHAFGDLIRLDAATLLWTSSIVYYFILDWRISAPFGLFSIGLYYLARAMPQSALWGCFAVGWGFQIWGHAVYEKRRPAFVKNLKYLWVGPLWVFSELLGYESAK